ncbi:DUF349 domain-containing protein [Auritidibacter ignavus]|uniref:DUF349 domain-containing protein n=1 Tax=Auritidibacter ignavus TaxID=678932 RepID=UPI00244B8F01|nr:DUF349 domain-containing protein [Auritidibacter ignavus]WGH84543.1 DUF349 domain-containing protein [Auritidibacter ignavus]
MTNGQESDNPQPVPSDAEQTSPATESQTVDQQSADGTEVQEAAEAQEQDVLASTVASESAPEPTPAPKPSALAPKPGTPLTVPATATPKTPVAPAVPDFHTDLAQARPFADVAEDGTVFLIDGDDRVEVGQVTDATEDQALAYFVRKYDDVMAQLLLLEQRLSTDTATNELTKTLKPLADAVEARGMVGDMSALREKVAQLSTALENRREREKQARAEALEEQRQQREAVVNEAEELAAQDPQQIHWKKTSNRMKELFESWRELQKSGPRLSKDVEDALWKRFRSARNRFDKARRAFFSELDSKNAEAKKVKEKLISEAEELQHSTDWARTTQKYRDLMTAWKKAPRAARKEDDALWARFRAAQDVFFGARQAAHDEIDREFQQNLQVKEQILEEGRSLLPFTDVEKARATMNDLRTRWDEAGKVPRKDISRMDAGFRELEDALQQIEDDHWSRTNPETKARTNSALAQLEETIAQLETELAQAQEAGDERKIAEKQEALDARRAWLQAVQASAE